MQRIPDYTLRVATKLHSDASTAPSKVIKKFREDLRFHLRIRRSQGITQKEIAKKIEMSESNLSEALSDRHNLETLLKVAYAANLVVNIEVKQKEVYFERLERGNELYHLDLLDKTIQELPQSNDHEKFDIIEEEITLQNTDEINEIIKDLQASSFAHILRAMEKYSSINKKANSETYEYQ